MAGGDAPTTSCSRSRAAATSPTSSGCATSDAALANFFASGVLALGPMLGPVLWQLPENLRFDADVLDDFLGRLPRTTAAGRRARARATTTRSPTTGR